MLKVLKSSAAVGILVGGLFITPAMAQSASELAVRMTQMEDQLRQLMGQVEQLTYEVKQLKGQLGKTQDTGSLEEMPVQAAPARKTQKLAAAPSQDQGVEQIGQPVSGETEQIVTTVIKQDGTEEQVVINKAPGPKLLGTLKGSAPQGGDGTLQGQVLVPDTVEQGSLDPNSDAIETVALAPESPEALYERSNESLLRRQFSDAEAGFRTFVKKYPDHSLAGSAQYWLGETYYAQNDYRQAAQAFLQGYQQYPKSRRAADSLLKLGISLGRLGQKQQACAAYVAVSSEYPKAVEARKRAQAEARRGGCTS